MQFNQPEKIAEAGEAHNHAMFFLSEFLRAGCSKEVVPERRSSAAQVQFWIQGNRTEPNPQIVGGKFRTRPLAAHLRASSQAIQRMEQQIAATCSEARAANVSSWTWAG
jgi:hypothetical protein